MSRLAVVTVVLVWMLGTCVSNGVADASSLGQLQAEFAKTARKIKTIRSELRSTKARQAQATHKLAVAERQLHVSEARLRDTRSQLANTKANAERIRARLRSIERRLKKRNDLLSARLADTYKHGSVSYLSVLVGAADFSDLLSRGYVVRRIVRGDVQLIKAIKKDKLAVEKYKAMLEEQERRQATLERAQAGLTRTHRGVASERQRILSRIEHERAAYEAMLAAEEADSRRIAAFIRSMQKSPGGRKRLAQVWKGSFIRPVIGRLTSGFGWRTHPIWGIRSFHTGIDLACDAGTPISAAADGVVTFTGTLLAYGKSLIVDHGGGTSTFYGHCSRFAVSRGAAVKKGDIIGYVGSTGWSTGPHLHFEVRKNGVPVCPF